MHKINILFFTIVQFLLLFDNTKQSHARQAIMAVKAIGDAIKNPLFKQTRNIIKNPIIKKFGNTIKNSVGIFRGNKNSVKNLAYGLQEKYMRTRHNFGSKSVKYLGEEGIKNFKHVTSCAFGGGKQLVRTKGNKNIQMRSGAQMGGEELGSLINIVSKSKNQLPFLFVAGGLNKLSQFRLLPEDDDLKEIGNIKKVEQDMDKRKIKKAERARKYYQNHKEKLKEKSRYYRANFKNKINEWRKEYLLKNKDRIAEYWRKYYLKNKEYVRTKQVEYYEKNKNKTLEKQKEYDKNNKDKLTKNFSESQPVMTKQNFKPKVVFTEAELQSKLTKEQYHVTQSEGTEYPGTGVYNKFYEEGKYNCVVCKENLFGSHQKYNSGCGWPAFWGAKTESIVEFTDTSAGMVRTEVGCKNCGAHLGHVFPDGPTEKGGIRYCINSASLNFGKDN